MNNRTKNIIDLTATAAATCFLPVVAAVGFGVVTAVLIHRRDSLHRHKNPHRQWNPFAGDRVHDSRRQAHQFRVVQPTAPDPHATSQSAEVEVVT